MAARSCWCSGSETHSWESYCINTTNMVFYLKLSGYVMVNVNTLIEQVMTFRTRWVSSKQLLHYKNNVISRHWQRCCHHRHQLCRAHLVWKAPLLKPLQSLLWVWQRVTVMSMPPPQLLLQVFQLILLVTIISYVYYISDGDVAQHWTSWWKTLPSNKFVLTVEWVWTEYKAFGTGAKMHKDLWCVDKLSKFSHFLVPLPSTTEKWKTLSQVLKHGSGFKHYHIILCNFCILND